MRKTFLAIAACCLALTLPAQDAGKLVRPIIAISCSHPGGASSSAGRTYTESVLKAGGLPILIPVMEDTEAIEKILSLADGLILTGGGDIHPACFNEDPIPELGEIDDVRDVYDLALTRLAAERQIPMLGICRGEQVINVAFGGTLYQDIPVQYGGMTVNHRQDLSSRYPTHFITLLPQSMIAEVTGETELFTNTHHHQAVKDVAPGFRITAWAFDGIPEAIEAADGRPIWGVQFHPEGQAMYGDTAMTRLFEFLVEQASAYRRQKGE